MTGTVSFVLLSVLPELVNSDVWLWGCKVFTTQSAFTCQQWCLSVRLQSLYHTTCIHLSTQTLASRTSVSPLAFHLLSAFIQTLVQFSREDTMSGLVLHHTWSDLPFLSNPPPPIPAPIDPSHSKFYLWPNRTCENNCHLRHNFRRHFIFIIQSAITAMSD